MTANKPETVLYRAPTFSLLLASHGGLVYVRILTEEREGGGGGRKWDVWEGIIFGVVNLVGVCKVGGSLHGDFQ